MKGAENRIYEFDQFRLDTGQRVLFRDGRRVRTTPKVCDLLVVLVENAGRVVDTNKLIDQVWSDAFVEEQNVKVAVSGLRSALGDRAVNPEYIETVPKRGYRFLKPVRVVSGDSAEPIESRSISAKLPLQPTKLIGRETELDGITALIQQEHVRLTTLTGAGGVGKTRLAIQACSRLAQQFEGRVYFVSLAPLREHHLVPSAIAQCVGVVESGSSALVDQLKESLRGKSCLLVLDNFEHLLPAGLFIAELLMACPALKVLVTSRSPLHLRGENQFAIAPLEVPDKQDQHFSQSLLMCASVCLFLDRAIEVKPGFCVTEENWPAVSEICRRLDGLPLAIELAAARIKVFSPQVLLERLEKRLRFLTSGPLDLPDRQRTIWNAIAWSYDLLSDEEKTLFRKVAACRGGFTLEAAETLFNLNEDTGLDVLEGISSLLDKSLLTVSESPEGNARFIMLETIREFGLERLAAAGEEEQTNRTLGTFFTDLVEKADPELRGPNQTIWLRRLDDDLDNLRASLGWLREQSDIEMAMRLAGASWRFWQARGRLTEGSECLEALIAAGESGSFLPVRAKALFAAGALAQLQCRYDRAAVLLEQAISLYDAVGDKLGIASSLNLLGLLYHDKSDDDRASAILEEALALCRNLNNNAGVASSLNNLGLIALDHGYYEKAVVLIQESAEIRKSLDDKFGTASSLNNLGLAAFEHADYTGASRLFRECLQLCRELGDKQAIAAALNNLGEVAECQDNWEEAESLYKQSLELLRESSDTRALATSLTNLATVLEHKGEYIAAARLYAEGLTLLRQIGEKSGLILWFEAVAGFATNRADEEFAVSLLGASRSLRETIGVPLAPGRRAGLETVERELSSKLGECFEKLMMRARSKDLESVCNNAAQWIIKQEHAAVPISTNWTLIRY